MELPNSGKKYTALPAGIPPELGGILVEAGLLCLKSENYALFVDRNSGWKWSNGPEFRDEPMGSVMSSFLTICNLETLQVVYNTYGIPYTFPIHTLWCHIRK